MPGDTAWELLTPDLEVQPALCIVTISRLPKEECLHLSGASGSGPRVLGS